MAPWLYWSLLGLLAGTLAKFLVPGRDPPGCIVTIVLGILGAIVGGWVGTRLGWGQVTSGSFDVRSILVATAGAVVVLVVARLARRL
ncbi:MAG TPA: GlsB/YeaQ/YmgE family stress response membrane protein [Gemmatimonadaceae bacterium]|jgi:uncharacterized membrane protein YeaQ/YmgE (transglycosylase-associated protein family)|nr:GlsB/YeaQ/YmgE family stress response membrane protein [Gemmatimonadaceae bacterium]